MPRSKAILRSVYCEPSFFANDDDSMMVVVVSRCEMCLGRFWVIVRLRFPGDED